ncbi:MAG: MBL fold metallo-hydrolase [Anaerolineae bacterium]|nr:MBL fold metallo-hydrolase [Anaerolineae bacterium]
MTDLTPLTPTLWTNSSALFTYHSGIFVHDGNVVLVDPGISEPEINAIAQFIEARKWIVHAIILTHCHWDHILGVDLWNGAEVIAHNAFAREARTYHQRIREIIANTPNLALTRPFEMPEPSRWVGATMTLEIGDWELELCHTPGHAPDHLFVRETATGTVWTADMLSDEEIPFVSDNLGDYTNTMQKINADDFRMLVPCHGAPTRDPAEIRARIENDRRYIAELHGRVIHAVKAGISLQETIALCADIPYRQSVENNHKAHRRNVESAYAELGGDVDPNTVGWLQASQE